MIRPNAASKSQVNNQFAVNSTSSPLRLTSSTAESAKSTGNSRRLVLGRRPIMMNNKTAAGGGTAKIRFSLLYVAAILIMLVMGMISIYR